MHFSIQSITVRRLQAVASVGEAAPLETGLSHIAAESLQAGDSSRTIACQHFFQNGCGTNARNFPTDAEIFPKPERGFSKNGLLVKIRNSTELPQVRLTA